MIKCAVSQSKPTIGDEEKLAVEEVLKSGQLAMGPVVDMFERRFERYIGARYSCAVNSGTSALHLALLAMGVDAKDEVIVPSYSCTALLNAIGYIGAIPKPVDIDESTLCISSGDVGRKVTKNTKAIIAVHTFGMASDIRALKAVGVEIVEDCAHSLGGSIADKKMGTIGNAAVYSFYATKMMTTGEGGMITTSSKEIADRARGLREYDMPEDSSVRFNYKMTDIAASIGLAQLLKLDSFISRRRMIAKRYDEFFSRYSSVVVPERAYASDTFYRYVVIFKDAFYADSFMSAMCKAGIVCDRPVAKPLHRVLGMADAGFPVTSKIFDSLVSIPIYPSLTDNEIDGILENCKNYLKIGG